VPGAQEARPRPQEKALRACEQEREDVARERAAWRAELAGVDPARLAFVDETGIDTRMARAHARAARGRRAAGRVPRGRWERLTVTGALALDGVVASMSVAAATSAAVFLAFAEQVLAPALRDRPGAVVVMDNLAAHKAAAVREALDRAGLGRRHLPGIMEQTHLAAASRYPAERTIKDCPVDGSDGARGNASYGSRDALPLRGSRQA
jgi:hypothetical protein